MILQLSRYASVQYVWLKESHKAVLAETQFTLCVLFAAFFSSVITGIVVADNFRLASFWLVDFTFLHAANRENTPTSAGVRGSLAALASALLGLSLWLLVRFEPFEFLRQSTTSAIAYTLAFSALWTLVIAALYLYIGHDLLSEAKTLAVSALGAFFNSRPEEPAND